MITCAVFFIIVHSTIKFSSMTMFQATANGIGDTRVHLSILSPRRLYIKALDCHL